jgi:hypothetical protein
VDVVWAMAHGQVAGVLTRQQLGTVRRLLRKAARQRLRPQRREWRPSTYCWICHHPLVRCTCPLSLLERWGDAQVPPEPQNEPAGVASTVERASWVTI